MQLYQSKIVKGSMKQNRTVSQAKMQSMDTCADITILHTPPSSDIHMIEKGDVQHSLSYDWHRS